MDEGFSDLRSGSGGSPPLLAAPARDLLHASGALAGLGLWDLHRHRPAEAAAWFGKGAMVNDPRDRAARFLIGYGRVDPLVVIPPERRGFLFTDRVRYHGPILSRLRCRMLQAEALARTLDGR
ncbi:MAG: hypothetical protein HYU66_13735 [Armatimonadetes bacterium]|nr:hypothetical protein [Armatimonadota bacterium]